jgi:hypothetical protein
MTAVVVEAQLLGQGAFARLGLVLVVNRDNAGLVWFLEPGEAGSGAPREAVAQADPEFERSEKRRADYPMLDWLLLPRLLGPPTTALLTNALFG